MTHRRGWAWLAAVAGCGLLLRCGSINWNGSDNSFSLNNLRRLYVNDPAANDSLPPTLTGKGLYFVLQGGKSYSFQVDTPYTGTRLSWNRYAYGQLQSQGVLTGIPGGASQTFTLSSSLPDAGLFVGQLLVTKGVALPLRPGHVHLANLNPAASGSLAVHLMLVGQLSGKDTAQEKAFAQTLLDTLKTIYAAFGVAIDPSFALVNPSSPPVTVAFGSTFTPLPGTRVPGALSVYVVNNITQAGGSSSSMILGFAPREAIDLFNDPESRVILNASAGAQRLAATAAHEMGHFFGFRHTTATDLDLASDNDGSNVDDGFDDTQPCVGLHKVAAGSVSVPAGPRNPYCPYRAAVSCPVACDVTNLMFPYDCSNALNSQRTLSPKQKAFLQRNVGLFQGL